MKGKREEKKYVPEMSQKETENLRNLIQSGSKKVIADYIERMKKTSLNRPAGMQYFDEIANLFGQRQEELQTAKKKGKKVIGYFCAFAPIELVLGAGAIS